MATSYHIGRGLMVVGEDDRGVELEGVCRLAPGRQVVLFGLAPAPARGRRACVTTWRVVRAGRNGLIYRGSCEWLDGRGNPIPLSGPIRGPEAR